jgi:hypothetical protein
MNKYELTNRVASGLRKMEVLPDYLIYICNDEYVYDEDTISNIPVIYTNNIISQSDSSTINELKFIPCWKREFSTSEMNKFIIGYDEWSK